MARKFPFDTRKTVTPEDPIAENQVVHLQSEATAIAVRVTRVIESRKSYEGRILGFPNTPVTDMGELKVGEIVFFCHDMIWRA